MTRIGINGFGRIGRLALRAAWDRDDLEVVHVNEVAGGAAGAAHLLEFDSLHGRWDRGHSPGRPRLGRPRGRPGLARGHPRGRPHRRAGDLRHPLRRAYSGGDGVAANVGFYYMANAAGRLLGTLLSGAAYPLFGIVGCLLGAGLLLLLSGAVTARLPPQPHSASRLV